MSIVFFISIQGNYVLIVNQKSWISHHWQEEPIHKGLSDTERQDWSNAHSNAHSADILIDFNGRLSLKVSLSVSFIQYGRIFNFISLHRYIIDIILLYCNVLCGVVCLVNMIKVRFHKLAKSKCYVTDLSNKEWVVDSLKNVS